MADKPMCCEKLPGHKGGLRTWPCQNYGKVQVDGKWYCGIHDPEKTKQRDEQRMAELDRRLALSDRNSRIAKLKEEIVALAREIYLEGGDSHHVWFKVGELIAAEKECEP